MEFYTIIKVIAILVFLLLILWGGLFVYRWGAGSVWGKTLFFPPSVFQIDHRMSIDSKRQLLQVRDQKNIYTLLLGERDILLHKENIGEMTSSSSQKEDVVND